MRAWVMQHTYTLVFIAARERPCPTSYMQEAARDGQDSDVVFSKLDPSWGPEITQGATLLLLVSIY